MTQPEIAVVIITYQRPRNLALVLESIAAQRGVEGKIEVVVADDGSTDHTPQIVDGFRRRAPFPVKFVTHPHLTFQAARCRNQGVAATTAPYLLFADGDCVMPLHHVATHLAHRRSGAALIGNVCRLSEEASEKVTEELVRRDALSTLSSLQQRRELWWTDLRYRAYNWIRHPTKPRSLRSCDFSISRADYERVNGFDENFCGWGGEDDDLGRRLRRAGVRLEPVLRYSYPYHLWHPRDVTITPGHKQSPNIVYLKRKGRLICCRNGLVKRTLQDLKVRIVGRAARPSTVEQFIAGRLLPDSSQKKAEVELLFLPGEGAFSGAADCNVLVALEDSAQLRRLARQAHLVVAPAHVDPTPHVLRFPLDQWDQALQAVA